MLYLDLISVLFFYSDHFNYYSLTSAFHMNSTCAQAQARVCLGVAYADQIDRWFPFYFNYVDISRLLFRNHWNVQVLNSKIEQIHTVKIWLLLL